MRPVHVCGASAHRLGRSIVASTALVAGLLFPAVSGAQQPDTTARDTSLATGITAGESDAEAPRDRTFTKWNEFNGKYVTFRFGGGFLVDYGAYKQDDASKEQFDLAPQWKVRDARVILGGRFKTKRPLTWQAGFMYDGPTDTWFVRQTGIMVAVPELWGHFFIGRAKEGVSLNRVMVGYDGWTIERFPMSESIQLLADGVKWLGYLPNRHLNWNVGAFTDWLSEGQSFSSYDQTYTARVAWVPMVSDSAGTLLHIGVNWRTGKVNNSQLQVKARPESFTAPYFLDTGKFPATHSSTIGMEAYYRPGPLLMGGEYYLQTVDAPASGNPRYHGGDVFVSWLPTGETRSYNTVGGYFRTIWPKRTVFEGGLGAIEPLLRFSYTDLDDAGSHGGTFWRITPMVNWYLSYNLRLEFVYGYGSLDKFDKVGKTQFYQMRIQTRL